MIPCKNCTHRSISPKYHRRLFPHCKKEFPFSLVMYSTTLQNTLVLLLGLTNIVHGHEWIRNKIWGRAAAGDKLAKLLTPAIKPRASFIGGWALKEFPCPTEYEALDGGCCPKGSFGFSVNLQGLPKGFACCPDGEFKPLFYI